MLQRHSRGYLTHFLLEAEDFLVRKVDRPVKEHICARDVEEVFEQSKGHGRGLLSVIALSKLLP